MITVITWKSQIWNALWCYDYLYTDNVIGLCDTPRKIDSSVDFYDNFLLVLIPAADQNVFEFTQK